ncbi:MULTISPECIES: cation acetate symporter [unclassified Mycolicibacterium]|uniref:sodium/solute symporter n=1 Tax=unclassified Mycolicibacterium TaxID=2636767 RepID=UPI0012DDFB58|nr:MULTISPECIES: cation acetate symporter [unclassified Mycolicibacterium]MUL85049.1 cation acetate symporter [Mycolicibacterium sp. CBMA 329]MUL91016.1 cation acetate symporter [Mycolicibacterium sp. CBMA 331]MUL98313.1 cation acetate symporter [Mycolicibacterium sp. CBMA 334]MUM29078.1 cation acetate symporter [Mycolicibacterium sp. CBMA 295]MUM40775.1 cation acetate symporter [Mycolicibacterium sp. CBMA 247]
MTGAPLTAAALLAAVVATIAIGTYGVRLSRTTSDFLVASRSIGPQWNAAAISGEYLSAASFLGVAGLIAKYGADALWYPVGFTAGYLGVLLFVAAPLRRSGAYTVPDFAEFRLGSARLRKVAMLVVVVICLFYLAPQYQGAGLALKTLLGVPVWIGPLLVAGIVITNVVAGGMRSITFVQAFQYWLKLTAIAVPALALLGLFISDRGELGGPLPPTVRQQTTVQIETDVVVQVIEPAGINVTGDLDGRHVESAAITAPGQHTLGAGTTLTLSAGAATPVVAGTPGTGSEWIASGGGLGGGHPLYQVLSIIVATFLGTMGLPHVLVRFYTNPDGRAARRTALAVVALLSVFYFFPILLGVFSRLYVPQLLITGTADAAVLLAPGAAVGGIGGQLLAALVAAGAIAAFLATSSGLLVSIAGALATDVLRGRVRDFRIAAVVGGLIPIPLSLMVSGLELSRSVGLAFAVAASTLCPLLALGIWWRGLTVVGAGCGLVVGGCVSGGAVLVAITGGVDDAVLGGWPAVMVGYPAAVSVPIAFLTMIVVSLFTRPTPGVAQIFARMHVPERLGLSVERVPAG